MVERGTSTCARRGEIVTAVIVWLLLGAIVNVAVAWGCANWSQLGPSARTVAVASADRDVVARKGETIGANAFISKGMGVRCRVVDLHDPIAIEEAAEMQKRVNLAGGDQIRIMPAPAWVEQYRAGWPLACLSSNVWFHSKVYCSERLRPWPDKRFSVDGGIMVGDERALAGMPIGQRGPPMVLGRVLPIVPVWFGFAINTVFYAAILWMLFAAPGRVRRQRRIKRGLCAKCAYPVRASEVCSECGAKVKPRWVGGM